MKEVVCGFKLFEELSKMLNKVIIVAGNGFSGLINEHTSSPSIIEAIQDIYTPLSINGKTVEKLSHLKKVIHESNDGKAIKEIEDSNTSKITQVTNLNGIVLYNYLQQKGFSPIVVNDFEEDYTLLVNTLKEELLAIVISTTFMPFKEHLTFIANAIRQMTKTVPVIVGGPMVHMSFSIFQDHRAYADREILKKLYLFFEPDKDIDYYIFDRYGLKTLDLLLSKLIQKQDVANVPNLGVTVDNAICFTQHRPEIPDIADEFINWNKVPDALLRDSVSLRGSFGCPFKCKFCNFFFFSPQMMIKPRDMLMKELDQLSSRRSVKHISFVDDNMLLNHKEVETFCQDFIDNGYPFTWSSFIRPDSINKNSIKLLADSGANLLTFGVESGDRVILSNMNKKENLDHTLAVINGLGESNISTSTTLLVGFPGESSETVGNTIDFLNQYKSSGTALHWFSPFIFMMLPKVRIEEEKEKFGLEGFILNWKHQTMDSLEAAKQLKRLMLEVTDVFYPYSNEHLFADQILSVSPLDAIKVVKLTSEHVKNQIHYKEDNHSQWLKKNKFIIQRISELLA